MDDHKWLAVVQNQLRREVSSSTVLNMAFQQIELQKVTAQPTLDTCSEIVLSAEHSSEFSETSVPDISKET